MHRMLAGVTHMVAFSRESGWNASVLLDMSFFSVLEVSSNRDSLCALSAAWTSFTVWLLGFMKEYFKGKTPSVKKPICNCLNLFC